MRVTKYKIRPKWKNIGALVAVTLIGTVGFHAVGLAIEYTTGWVTAADLGWTPFGYDISYWVVGVDVVVGGLILAGLVWIFGGALVHGLFDIETTNESSENQQKASR